ncbi:hypothetical protein BDV41DRAFT_540861 [Aspergillus transmontanensis]|uniref:MYND-type domain-containing protein n=1 Tax=Aspergillus transmontanensis TaxID=1034304 RepID=A0A5N6VTN7_9EURO|nr:hypothetical protein BDV41DRAFT_540861 [Aspergillus transmontanensis]
MTNQENTPSCSFTSCQNAGTRRCTGCKVAAYCSPACQKDGWKTHRKACTGAKKYNCFLIRAVPSDLTKGDLTEADYIEPMPLDSYGEWSPEMKELKKRTRWDGILEPGKFYSHRPVDRWHYHVYQQYEKTETPRNPLVSRCFKGDIHGDVAVVRSCWNFTRVDTLEMKPSGGPKLAWLLQWGCRRRLSVGWCLRASLILMFLQSQSRG